MSFQKISYTNKQQLNANSSVADINKIKADDMNEIKSVVNNNADELLNNEYSIIVEKDINPQNGNGYIKYDNGFMLQWKSIQVTAGGTQWTSAIYISNHTMGNWGVPFTSILSFWTSCSSYDFWTSAGSVNTTSAGTLRCYRPTSSTAQVWVNVTAIGRWK